MAYNDLVNRAGAAGDVPEQIAEQIVGDIQTESTVLALGREVPTTTTDSRVPVLSHAPDAAFVSEGGLKSVTKAEWANEPLVAEEIAAIVVVPDNVIADSNFDLWGALRPLMIRAFARRIDRAAIFNDGKPASWGTALLPAAIAANTTVVKSTGADVDPAADILAAAELIAGDASSPTGAVVRPGWEYGAARARTQSFVANPIGATLPYAGTVAGLGIRTRPVFWNTASAEALVVDWTNVLVGVRQDIRFEVINTGVLQDETGAITFNLLQQDMSAMRCTMRVGYLLAQPVDGAGAPVVPVSAVVPA